VTVLYIITLKDDLVLGNTLRNASENKCNVLPISVHADYLLHAVRFSDTQYIFAFLYKMRVEPPIHNVPCHCILTSINLLKYL
jgi:hypothetical protein